MDQDMMKFKEELQELVRKGQALLQKMQGGNYGQRDGYYGMRDNGSQGGNQNGGYQGGSYGQRQEPWMHSPQNFPDQGSWPNGQQNWGAGGGFPIIDPRYFM